MSQTSRAPFLCFEAAHSTTRLTLCVWLRLPKGRARFEVVHHDVLRTVETLGAVFWDRHPASQHQRVGGAKKLNHPVNVPIALTKL